MATTLNPAAFNVSINATASDTKGLASISTPLSLPQLIAYAFTNGTGANKANQIFQATGTLAISSTADIDLYAFGAVTDGAGNAVTMATIKLLIFQLVGAATPVEADYITIGGKGATSGWTSFFGANTHTGKIFSGGFFAIGDPGATGYVVGASTTNHLLTLTTPANTGTVTYNIIVIGATA